MTVRNNEQTEAPEAVNREQEDDGQVVDASDMVRAGETVPVGDSTRARRSNPAAVIPDDVPDVVDRMEEMVQSGQVDNGAFDGEPVHDDEEGSLGDTGAPLDEDEARP